MSSQIFLQQLEREIKTWEDNGLVDPESIQRLRQYYGLYGETSQPGSDDSDWTRWVLYLAVFAFLAAFFSFAGSQSTSLGPSLRVVVLLVGSLAGLGLGWFVYPRRRFEGVALLILGGMLLPITLFFAVHYYKIWTPHSPFLWWSATGALLGACFIPLARSLKEEGLAFTSLLNFAAIPFLLVAHVQGSLLWFPTVAVFVALGLQVWRRLLPSTGWSSFVRPLWFLGHVATLIAVVFPIAAKRFDTSWAAGIYFGASLFYFNQILLSSTLASIPLFVIVFITGCASLLSFLHVGNDIFPLIFLTVSSSLITVSLTFIHRRPEAALSLLRTIFALLSLGLAPVWFMRPNAFRSPMLLWFTVACFVCVGIAMYIIAMRRNLERMLLSYIGGLYLYLGWVFVCLSFQGMTVEAYLAPLGLITLINSTWFTEPRWKEQTFVAALALLVLPTLFLSITDLGATRTVLLSLIGIGLISWGAIEQEMRKLSMGILVLLPTVSIKLWPGLRSLGIPWFVWFALFGIVLFVVAFVMQRK